METHVVFVNSPIPTKVAWLATTIPIPFKPIKAMNSPIPPPTASLSDTGIELAIFSLIPPIDRIKKKHPDKNTIPNAVCQGTCLSKVKV